MKRATRWYDYITINIYYLGLTTLSQTNGLIFPLLVQQYVGEELKGSYLGSLRLWALMAALLTQSLTGMLSDRSRLRWGRRRPFIFTGTILELIFVTLIGFSTGLQGLSGFGFLFIVAILLQISANIAQSAQQGLIPDLVPEAQRGRFSGFKAVLELPLPLILVSFTVARLISAGHTWTALFVVMGVLALTMLITLLVPETVLEVAPSRLDWTPILRLVLMTGLFTAVILGTGAVVNLAGRLLCGIGSTALLLALMGLTGLSAMLIAVGLGVWISIRLSIGSEAAAHYPSFTWWVINRLAFLVGAVNLSIFTIYFLQARLGYVREKAAGPASVLILIVGVFILISAIPSGWLADRFGSRLVVAVSGVLAALGTLTALMIPKLEVIYAGGILIGVGAGLFYAANWALGTELVPKSEAGRYLGISNLAGAGAGAVGAYIGGPIADYFTARVPQTPGLGYILLFSIYGLLFVFSVVALTRIKML
jgi:MFS family permease